jgi:PAS domain S-box-containing protein
MESMAPSSPLASTWDEAPSAQPARCAHAVQFYESENFLVGVVGEFLVAGLDAGDSEIVIATEPHRRMFLQQLAIHGSDAQTALATGQLVMLDARETLAKFMVAGMPDWGLFRREVGTLLQRMRAQFPERALRAYGEMVNLLWQDGNPAAAIRLEELWNDLAKVHQFGLLCAYAMKNFGDQEDASNFDVICRTHSHVSPTERYDQTSDAGALLAEVSALQQRAHALEGEVARRRSLEKALREALAQRRDAEEQLRASQQELSDFFENAVEGLHRVGPDGTILSANRAELELLGYERSEYVGHHVAEFHADPNVADDLLARLSGNETVRDYEAKLRCKDGSFKYVLINSNALFRDGQFVHSRCFTRDITDRKRLEEELLRQNEDLSRTVRFSETFVGILGHDLRNPLSGITTAAALLARRADSERVAKPATRILNSGRRMARMIDQLLDFTRIRLGKGLPLERKSINLDEVCRLAVDEVDELVDSGRVSPIDVTSSGDVIGAWDADRLSQLISNLLGNALAHGTGDSGVQIRVDGTNEDHVALEISNAGCISPEARETMFEPLKNLADRKAERSSGLGLGLYISQQIVLAHAGSIDVVSTTEAGTRITVRLPRTGSKTEAAFPNFLSKAS